jgi:hypothetical protein
VLFCFLRFPKVPRCSPSWDRIIENDRHPPSPRIRILKEIRAEIKPYPAREPAPPLKHYEPPREREKSALDTCAEARLGAISGNHDVSLAGSDRAATETTRARHRHDSRGDA